MKIRSRTAVEQIFGNFNEEHDCNHYGMIAIEQKYRYVIRMQVG